MVLLCLVFVLIVSGGFTEASESPTSKEPPSASISSSDCTFNWDDVQKPEKMLLNMLHECTKRSKRSIVMKHHPELKIHEIKDQSWGLARIHAVEKWHPYELQATSSVIHDLDEQELNDEFMTEKDQLEFRIDLKAGLGVDVYILDTGINISHEEFGGRVRMGKNFVENESEDDLNGHGTHVAGIIGSSSYGVAKQVSMISVKCLNKNKQGQTSDILLAIYWAISSSIKRGRPSIIHLSAIVLPDEKIDQAVEAAAQSGVPVIVAGGNDFQDACKLSPARTKHAFTVSGVNSKDQRPANMAQGDCVDLFAPGVDILSTYIGSDLSKAYMSGTSMAAPYVTGIAASALSRGFDMGSCISPHFDSNRQKDACASKLYDYLKESSDYVAGLRIARIPKDLLTQ